MLQPWQLAACLSIRLQQMPPKPSRHHLSGLRAGHNVADECRQALAGITTDQASPGAEQTAAGCKRGARSFAGRKHSGQPSASRPVELPCNLGLSTSATIGNRQQQAERPTMQPPPLLLFDALNCQSQCTISSMLRLLELST